MTVVIDRCPLCGGRNWTEHSLPEANLYSESLAQLLSRDEGDLLEEYGNWLCERCGLICKRRWFDDAVVQQLFAEAVAVHPRGWDTVIGRFSPAGFQAALTRWAEGVKTSTASDVRRGDRELRSIIGALSSTSAFDRDTVLQAIAERDVTAVRTWSEAIVSAIGQPAPFSRFSGFRSRRMWDYLEDKTGGVGEYAEVGCPLWGLLPIAHECGSRATFLIRDEPNYWGYGCRVAGQNCVTKLLADSAVDVAEWIAPQRFSMIGLFQYLDHLADPRRFFGQLFAKADSAAVVLDDVAAPVAIQHVTGWTDASMAYVAECFGKILHTDFEAIRPSGNVLYVLSGRS